MGNRRAERVNFFSGGELIKGERTEEVTIVDISLNGVLLASPDSGVDWQIGENVGLNVNLNDTGLRMEFAGVVRRSELPFIGLEFREMDIDTATHLRRLLELNSGRPAWAERSFEELSE